MGPGADWFADASDASDATDAPQHRQTIGVAIRVPEPFGPILQAKRAEFNDPLADSIPAHVTLLGPTVVHHVARPALVEHLARVASEVGAFPMALRGTGTFRPVSDVVFVQVALGISGCERLEQRIRTGPYAADLTFPYHPHVTVAHDVAEADLDRAFDDLADFRADFEVAEIWLFEQDRLGQWRPVRSFPLTGPAPTR
ncbi:MAG: 2'-5' RNA ligase family protein [Actinomycetales bacterium]|jgi:2'-5' RNA ligase|nr:2'-5' RNA ligase family protein [Candidatus Phosphoribacter baldrii]